MWMLWTPFGHRPRRYRSSFPAIEHQSPWKAAGMRSAASAGDGAVATTSATKRRLTVSSPPSGAGLIRIGGALGCKDTGSVKLLKNLAICPPPQTPPFARRDSLDSEKRCQTALHLFARWITRRLAATPAPASPPSAQAAFDHGSFATLLGERPAPRSWELGLACSLGRWHRAPSKLSIRTARPISRQPPPAFEYRRAKSIGARSEFLDRLEFRRSQ
jgi:hypothetical protein